MTLTVRKTLQLIARNEGLAVDLVKIAECDTLPKNTLSKGVGQLRLNHVYDIAEILGLDPATLVVYLTERRCRECGCTQTNCEHCIEKTGDACHWVGDDLCSACLKF